MINLWTKSILSLPLIGLAILNLIVMLELLGRTEKRYDPKSLRLIHRIGGICYIVLFITLSYFCLRLMRAAGQAIEPVSGMFGQLYYRYAGIPIGVIEVDGVAGPWRLFGTRRDCPLRKAASYARAPISSPDSPFDSR